MIKLVRRGPCLPTMRSPIVRQIPLFLLLLFISACNRNEQVNPTREQPVTRIAQAPSATPGAATPEQLIANETVTNTPHPAPPTNTPRSTATTVTSTASFLPTPTPMPTKQPLPTNTPTATQVPPPTETPAAPTMTPLPPTATPTEPPTTPVINDVNLLPNSSFEEGYYHPSGIPELQVPNNWTLEWDEGYNPLDPDPWNVFVRPESRVLSRDFLPQAEHPLFIWHGNHTVKIFKQTGSLSFRLVTYPVLDAGTYLFQINVFPDMIDGYNPDGSKIWAPDPLSGELQFIVNSPQGSWIYPIFGQRNTFQHYFVLPQSGTVRLGVAFRGRWAIENNGWFLDDWSLRQVF
jgi:hypothetical protein